MQENFRSSILHGSSDDCVSPGVHSFACSSLGVAGCGMPDDLFHNLDLVKSQMKAPDVSVQESDFLELFVEQNCSCTDAFLFLIPLVLH